MITTISPSAVSGSIKAPSSKSCTQRAYAASLIYNGTTIIENAGESNDEHAARKIVESLGLSVQDANQEIIITSPADIFSPGARKKDLTISCGESGLSLRMFTPLVALFDYPITFTGEGSILKRPVDFFEEILPKLGVEIRANNGKIPLVLKGPLVPKNITVDGSLSSQFLTGLLMAYAKACTAPVSIGVRNLSSKPYIDLTLGILKHFGFNVDNEKYETFHISPRTLPENQIIKYVVEGDWSNAAFLLVTGAIAGMATVTGIDANSPQGDKKIIEALELCGASVSIREKEVSVTKKNLVAFDFDATHSPDLFPPLVALASYCSGTTTIKGVNRLLHKESNRADTLTAEFTKMKVDIDINDDMMFIHGRGRAEGAIVSSHNDHRIAMACAVAALGANGNTVIHEADAVKKSYPSFFEDLKMLNVRMQIS